METFWYLLTQIVHEIMAVKRVLRARAITFRKKSSQRDASTARVLAVVWFGHRLLTHPLQTHKPTDRTYYNTLHRS